MGNLTHLHTSTLPWCDGVVSKTRKRLQTEYLFGKRHGVREARELDVECVGTGATIRARTVDLSRVGMLVEAHDGTLPPLAEGELVPLALLVAVAFKDGMRATFGSALSVRAEVVRVTTSPEDAGFLRLGCRFTRLLTPRQCRLLGIDDSEGIDASLDLARTSTDGVTAPVLPVELVEVSARRGRRKPAVRIAPLRERRRPDT